MSKYNFNLTFPRNDQSNIKVDSLARYGYWEYRDGSEGGGLWFDPAPGTRHGLTLRDYDGAAILPKQVVEILHREEMIPANELFLYQ